MTHAIHYVRVSPEGSPDQVSLLVSKISTQSNSVASMDASAVIYSLMLTCRACDVEPYAYLQPVLTALPKRKAGEDVTDLLPFNYTKA